MIGLDKAIQAAAIQNVSSNDVLAQAVQELHVAGYRGIEDYLQAIGQPGGRLDGGGEGDPPPPPSDTRQQITASTTYPYRAIGRLTFNGGWCSGAMVRPFDFLTAGHCIGPGNGTLYSGFQVALGQNETSRPYGQAVALYYHTYSDWFNGGNTADDFALLTLDRNVGNFTGWFQYQWRSNSGDFNGLTVNDAGYPQDKDSGTQMWGTLGGRTDHADNNYVYFKYDIGHGQSGEPDWCYDGTNRYINYITTYGDCGNGNHCGTRINQDKFNNLSSWISDDNAHHQPTNKADLTDYDTWFGTHFSSFSPGTVYQGQNLSGHTLVQNNGTANTGAFTTRFYIATNPDLNHTNYVLADGRIGVGAYNWSYVNATGTVSYSIPAGRYYLGWYLDLNNEIAEFDKSNNRGGHLECRLYDPSRFAGSQRQAPVIQPDSPELVGHRRRGHRLQNRALERQHLCPDRHHQRQHAHLHRHEPDRQYPVLLPRPRHQCRRRRRLLGGRQPAHPRDYQLRRHH